MEEVDTHPSGWRATGQWLMLLVVLVSAGLWLNAQSSLSVLSHNWLLTVGRLCGVLGVTLYTLNIILAARLKVYEKLFGALNTVYRVHHTNGGLAFILMLSHPLFLILGNWRYPNLLKLYLLPSKTGLLTAGYTWGVMAIWMLIILLSLTYWARIPYQYWKRTHYFMGVVAVPLFLHIWLVPSDVQRNGLLKWWLLGLLIVATIARGYRFLWLRYVQRGKRYTISNIRKLGAVTEVSALPVAKPLKYLPGQFAFVTYQSKGIAREEHPFTISTYDPDGRIRFSMKNRGDFTGKLGPLKRGDPLYLHGPFGIFGHTAYETDHELVMVAGGIGITPFLSLLRYLALHDKQRRVILFYSVKEKQEAVYMKEILELKAKLKNLRLVAIDTDSQGMLTGEIILAKSGKTKNRRKFLICGPPAMQHALAQQLTAQGIKNLAIETELFSL